MLSARLAMQQWSVCAQLRTGLIFCETSLFTHTRVSPNNISCFRMQVRESVSGFLEQRTRREGESIFRHPRSLGCMRLKMAAPVVITVVPLDPEEDEEHPEPREPTHQQPGLGKEVEEEADKEMLALALHARNSTSSNESSSFDAFEASRVPDLEPVPTMAVANELERD